MKFKIQKIEFKNLKLIHAISEVVRDHKLFRSLLIKQFLNNIFKFWMPVDMLSGKAPPIVYLYTRPQMYHFSSCNFVWWRLSCFGDIVEFERCKILSDPLYVVAALLAMALVRFRHLIYATGAYN